ncbi:hypothetical protein HMPREF9141_0968 [Prevotella multiformis DSM 16608]|uniref:SlyB protein n=2 Tax=Prevotella multiformis TaxID=282402 RepID=F0F5V2_9BACT|nr:hypothetical protein HMPREF9141_0968 [Prevotella multiformis DSM 16608]
MGRRAEPVPAESSRLPYPQRDFDYTTEKIVDKSLLIHDKYVYLQHNFKQTLNMKRLLLMGIMILSVLTGFSQNTAIVNNLKEQQKVLDLTAKLNKLQLDYEKEKANYNAISEKAASVNADANSATTNFTASDPSSTVKQAKDTVKKLEETKAVNKKLAKSQKDMTKMEQKMAKLQSKIDKLNKKVQIIDK